MARNEDAARFEEIMEAILELTEEAAHIANQNGENAREWYAALRQAVDRDNSGFVGGGPYTDMARTLDAIRDERCYGCGERFGGEIQPALSTTDGRGNPVVVCRYCREERGAAEAV